MKEDKINKPGKGFFGRLFEKLDKNMEEKAKSAPCCCSKQKKDGNSCCS